MTRETDTEIRQPAVFRTGFGFPLYLFSPLILICFYNSIWPQPAFLSQVLSAAGLVVLIYFMLSTNYRVQDGVLHVRMGPFRRRVDVASIRAVTDYGRSTGRVYGLGTHIVGIVYEGGAVDITPKDVDGFMAAIGFSFSTPPGAGPTR